MPALSACRNGLLDDFSNVSDRTVLVRFSPLVYFLTLSTLSYLSRFVKNLHLSALIAPPLLSRALIAPPLLSRALIAPPLLSRALIAPPLLRGAGGDPTLKLVIIASVKVAFATCEVISSGLTNLANR